MNQNFQHKSEETYRHLPLVLSKFSIHWQKCWITVKFSLLWVMPIHYLLRGQLRKIDACRTLDVSLIFTVFIAGMSCLSLSLLAAPPLCRENEENQMWWTLLIHSKVVSCVVYDLIGWCQNCFLNLLGYWERNSVTTNFGLCNGRPSCVRYIAFVWLLPMPFLLYKTSKFSFFITD